MADEIKPQQQARIKPEVALRNIVRNMEIEGFQVSDRTREKCWDILLAGEAGKCVADRLVREILGEIENKMVLHSV